MGLSLFEQSIGLVIKKLLQFGDAWLAQILISRLWVPTPGWV